MYLLHFAEALERKQHYVGSCNELEPRLAQHAAGSAAVLTKRFHRAGIAFVVAATWDYDTLLEARGAERHLKTLGASSRCAICTPGRAATSPTRRVPRPRRAKVPRS